MRAFHHRADHTLSGPTRYHFKTGTLAEKMCFIRKRGGTGETQEMHWRDSGPMYRRKQTQTIRYVS